MKKRMIALLLLLALALTACTTTVTPPAPSTRPAPTEATELTEATETTEEITEAPTETDAPPTEEARDVDLGTTEIDSYKNETLGLSCSFPEGWYLYNQTDLAALNNLLASAFDSSAIKAALENSQAVIIFCASYPATVSSVNITVSKNMMSGMSEEEIIRFSLPLMKSQVEQTGVMQNVACEAAEAEFCGKTHAVLNVTGETAGMTLYETVIYLPIGDLLYNVTVSSADEASVAEILSLFEAIN